MKLLIVAATEAEIAPFLARYRGAGVLPQAHVAVLVTGVGMVATTYVLGKALREQWYDLVLQVGVGGAFDRGIHLGEVVFVTSDRFADLGTEDHDQYLDIFEMGLLDKNESPYNNGSLPTPLFPVHDSISMPRVNGLTVNTVSGNERTIRLRSEKYKCQVESMEGAAFHYVCLMEQVPFAQVRAISNYVTPRDKSQWKMKEAIINLNNWLAQFVEGLIDDGGK